MSQCCEIVIYTIKHDCIKEYLILRQKIYEHFFELEGFISFETKENIEKEEWIDMLIWSNKKNALRASQKFRFFPEKVDFLNTIQDVHYSGFYETKI